MSVETSATTNDPAAHALLRAGHEAVYRYGADFGGFRAAVRLVQDGASVTGSIELRSSRSLDIDLAADEQGLAWLRQEVSSLMGHRWSLPYDQGDGRYALSLAPPDDHPLGRRIIFHDDPFGSLYRLRDGHVTQIERKMAAVRFVITVLGRDELPDGRTLPTHFTVAYWDAEAGRIVRADSYTDRYVEIDGVYLPASRRVVTAEDRGIVVRELVLAEHALLAPVERDANGVKSPNARGCRRWASSRR
jgi:hypothetical protein